MCLAQFFKEMIPREPCCWLLGGCCCWVVVVAVVVSLLEVWTLVVTSIGGHIHRKQRKWKDTSLDRDTNRMVGSSMYVWYINSTKFMYHQNPSTKSRYITCTCRYTFTNPVCVFKKKSSIFSYANKIVSWILWAIFTISAPMDLGFELGWWSHRNPATALWFLLGWKLCFYPWSFPAFKAQNLHFFIQCATDGTLHPFLKNASIIFCGQLDLLLLNLKKWPNKKGTHLPWFSLSIACL